MGLACARSQAAKPMLNPRHAYRQVLCCYCCTPHAIVMLMILFATLAVRNHLRVRVRVRLWVRVRVRVRGRGKVRVVVRVRLGLRVRVQVGVRVKVRSRVRLRLRVREASGRTSLVRRCLGMRFPQWSR